MKKIILWASSTAAAVALLFGYHTSTSGVVAAQGNQTDSGPFSGTTTTDPETTAAAGASPSAAAAATYVGETAQTRWGPMQVQITVTDGSISSVDVLQYPSGNPKDEQINGYALPILIENTLQAQSSQVDMISGATVTSAGYEQSLQSALDQAGL
ncbi:FMN-binding protein [Nocardioides sp.]|uniref:FMN-binding protein n=1 Tax=Nocardioides sp. TaxID=35761 RepID=UPI00356A0EFE